MTTSPIRLTVLSLATVFLVACGNSASPSIEPANKPAEPAKTPLIQKTQIADWCPEHGVPESICTRCNSKLISGFQAIGDWCKGHGLPESQCLACNPEQAAKFEAMAPKTDD